MSVEFTSINVLNPMEVDRLKMQAEIRELREKLGVAVNALEFYAEKSNWVSRTGKVGICAVDTSDRELNTEEYPFAGGKMAREALSRIRGGE